MHRWFFPRWFVVLVPRMVALGAASDSTGLIDDSYSSSVLYKISLIVILEFILFIFLILFPNCLAKGLLILPLLIFIFVLLSLRGRSSSAEIRYLTARNSFLLHNKSF